MGIPKPLVKLNQSFVILSVVLSLIVSKYLLLVPFFIGVYTLVTKSNPIIMLGKPFFKKKIKEYTLEDKDQQLFNQWIATICIGLSFIGFVLGFQILGYIFSIMVILAATVALCGFCIGCFIHYQYKMWHYRRKQKILGS